MMIKNPSFKKKALPKRYYTLCTIIKQKGKKKKREIFTM